MAARAERLPERVQAARPVRNPVRVLVRAMAAADSEAVEWILKQCPEAAQWSARELLRALGGDIRIWVAEDRGKVIGMAAAQATAVEAEILNLAILPAQRRHGLGRRLLEAVIVELKAAGAGVVFLEVRESNSVGRTFYTSAGFVEVGRRRSYYRDPVEDALVVSLPLPSC